MGRGVEFSSIPDGEPRDGFDAKFPAALLLVTVLGFLLRGAALDAQSFWYDEAYTATISQASFEQMATGRAKDNGNPPLYFMLAKAWSGVFGDSAVAFRALPAIFGALTVPLVGLLGRRLVGPNAGLLAAVLMAISPTSIELSTEARTYALVGFLGVASTLFFVRWATDLRPRDLVPYVLTLAAAWYCHYYSFVLLLVHGAGLVFLRRDRRRDLGWLAAILAAMLLWGPWVPSFLAQLRTPGNLGRMGESWRLQFLGTPLVFAFGRSLAWRESGKAVQALATLAAVLSIWLPACWALFRLRRRPPVAALLGVWALAPILGPLAVALTVAPIYATRYAYVGLPAFLILAAAGLCLAPRWARWAALAVVAACTGVSLYRYETTPLKDDWRSAAAMILDHIGDEVVATDQDIETLPFMYYARRPGRVLPPLVGITGGPGPAGAVQGVRFPVESEADREPVDQTAQIFGRDGLWLALRTPKTAADEYIAFARDRGYELKEQHQYHRIELLHFVRAGRE